MLLIKCMHNLLVPAASDGSDYKGDSMNFVFTAGTSNGTMQCIDVGITNTRTVEEDETFIVTLTTSNSVILGNNMTTITITDADSMFINNYSSHFVLRRYMCLKV